MDFKKILFKTNSIDVEKALPDAVMFINKEGKIQWVNDVAAELFETSKMHLMTSNIDEFLDNAKNILANAAIINKPVIAKSADKELYYDLTVREIQEGYVLDFRFAADSLKPDSEDEDAQKINRAKNNFLIKLENDIKSPLQSIVGFSQAMSDGLGGDMSEQQKKYVRIINKNSNDLMYFMGKLIELSQTESELKSPEYKAVDTVALTKSIIKYNEQLFNGKDVKISVNQSENYRNTVSLDQNIFKNILQDLLEIVLKSVDMGDININLSIADEDEISSKGFSEGNYIKISLESSALLLSENDLECMFDPYAILDSVNRKNVLRAIVLASVKNLVQLAGGIIWVESQILKSTSFNVILPIQ